jgi:hypothetical protein
MTTSTSSGLSPEAKEFIPSLQIPPSLPPPPPPPATIPLYVDENTITSFYTNEQPPLIYPLIKIPDIEFHISSSTNDNPSQIVLLPTSGCYPNAPISNFYPIDYSEQSLINYSLQQQHQPKSNRISTFRPQRDFNQLMNRNFRPTNSKRTPKGTHSRSLPQKKENNYQIPPDKNSFKLQTEDFPSLPINHHLQIEKKPTPVPTSIDTKLVSILMLKFKEFINIFF